MTTIEAVTAEVMEEFTDALAPEWAGEAQVAWEASATVADDAGVDAEAVWREQYAERFYPKDEAQMEWVLRKRNTHVKRVAQMAAQMDFEIDTLKRLWGERIAAEQREADYFTAMAEVGVRTMEPDGKGKRTMRTIVGTVYMRHTESIVWPEDDDAIIELGRALGVEPRVKVTPDKASIKAKLEVASCDGELVVINKETAEPIDTIEAKAEDTVIFK